MFSQLDYSNTWWKHRFDTWWTEYRRVILKHVVHRKINVVLTFARGETTTRTGIGAASYPVIEKEVDIESLPLG